MTNSGQTNAQSKNHILLTIDVEDWFQVENFKPYIPFSTWSERELRVEHNVHRLLDLLDTHQPIPARDGTKTQIENKPARATFFILGWVAEKLPQLIRAITSRGHEVASHGYSHQLCHEQNLSELTQDLIRSKHMLEDMTGSGIYGYRAPSFSINDQVLEILEQCGYRYDSSYNSFEANPRYGHLDMSRYKQIGGCLNISDNFQELPLSNLKFMNRTLPWSGGGYFRLMPYIIFRQGMRKILSDQGHYLFYLHPWEIDDSQPRVTAADRLSRFRHYCNLKSTHQKMRKLLKDNSDCLFSTCRDYLQSGHILS